MSEPAALDNAHLGARSVVRLGELVGAGHVVTDGDALALYEVDGLRPSAIVRPGSGAEIVEIVRFAAAERRALIPVGGRTKLGIGMPPRHYDLAVDMSRMNRVLAYDPRDLTLGVEPGVRFADLSRRLAEENQFLPLAPAFADRATLGGIAAANADTPLRYGFGSTRDHLLGMEFVTGAGVLSKSGGRVVKNVSGYDLHKLLIGSLGTLAVITRLNFRTFPRPPEQRTYFASLPDAAAALDLCRSIAKSQLQLWVVEAWNPGAAQLLAEEDGPRSPSWSVVAVAAGQSAAVVRHGRDLQGMAREARASDFRILGEAAQDVLFGRICDFSRLALEKFPGAAIFRIAVLPAAMPALLEDIRGIAKRNALGQAILVRAVGIVYAALLPPFGDDGAAARMMTACRDLMTASMETGARPTIEWCPLGVKRGMSVWPPPGGEQAIADRLKNVFDPRGILASGRFRGGI